ncbi:MAG: GrpB family protein [Propionibacteriales bacterium]|nr:GrpB family protein [Propionibacteriales bacterium]
MPFADELPDERVTVHPYNPRWAADASALAAELRAVAPGGLAGEHIGSTSIEGLAAKNCLDMMIVVEDLAATDVGESLAAVGYRRRREPWNTSEDGGGRSWPKMVFAPAAGQRAVNLHVRVAGSAPVRTALLFRDHLRANPSRTAWWSELKITAARHTNNLQEYGELKYPAWHLLMDLAEAWGRDTEWSEPTFR